MNIHVTLSSSKRGVVIIHTLKRPSSTRGPFSLFRFITHSPSFLNMFCFKNNPASQIMTMGQHVAVVSDRSQDTHLCSGYAPIIKHCHICLATQAPRPQTLLVEVQTKLSGTDTPCCFRDTKHRMQRPNSFVANRLSMDHFFSSFCSCK